MEHSYPGNDHTRAVSGFESSTPFLILVCGLPGSGKSTFSTELLSVLPINQILRIDPDIFEQELLLTNPKSLEQTKNQLEESPNKDGVQTNTTEPESATSFDSSAWRAARDRALLETKQTLQTGRSVLVEDTFLLRGYRRRFRAVARDAKALSCEIELVASQGLLLTRNQLRKGTQKYLEEQTLLGLAEKMETGDNPYKIVVESRDGSIVSEVLLERIYQSMQDSRAYLSHTVTKMNVQAFSDVIEDEKEKKDPNSIQNAAELELVLRKFVSEYFTRISKRASSDKGTKDVGTLSKEIAVLKKEVYEHLKAELFGTSGSAKISGNFMKPFAPPKEGPISVDQILKYLEEAFEAKLTPKIAKPAD